MATIFVFKVLFSFYYLFAALTVHCFPIFENYNSWNLDHRFDLIWSEALKNKSLDPIAQIFLFIQRKKFWFFLPKTKKINNPPKTYFLALLSTTVYEYFMTIPIVIAKFTR